MSKKIVAVISILLFLIAPLAYATDDNQEKDDLAEKITDLIMLQIKLKILEAKLALLKKENPSPTDKIRGLPPLVIGGTVTVTGGKTFN